MTTRNALEEIKRPVAADELDAVVAFRRESILAPHASIVRAEAGLLKRDSRLFVPPDFVGTPSTAIGRRS